jgi:signal transduction histidine kinase
MIRKQRNNSLVTMTAVLVGLTAMLAAAVLWLVTRVQQETSHTVATRNLLAQGGRAVAILAAHPAVTNAETAGGAALDSLSELVDGLHALENSIEYVSVVRGGVTVFHRPTSPVDGSAAEHGPLARTNGRTRLLQKRISVRGESVPVVVFSREIKTGESVPVAVEVGVRHEAVGSRQAATSSAVTAMFRVALATVVTALLGCMAIVAWLMGREFRREEQRRREEHLAFSGVLANGIAHDFRNPMSSLRLDIQMLEKEVADDAANMRRDRVVSLASRIRSTLDRMDKVFQEFLYLSRPEDGGRERADLCALVRECLDIMAPRFEHAGVVPQAELPAAPVPVSVHTSSLKRALVNILANAEQFAGHAGAVRVAVSAARDRARIDISDSGPGIPLSERRRVFDMFYTTRPEGTGLGLYLAKSAVERSGGTIAVVDGRGKGACMRIELPLAAGGEQPAIPTTTAGGTMG